MKRVQVSSASEADIPRIVALERACYTDPWVDSAFAELPGNPRVFFSVARDPGDGAGEILGYVVAWYVLDEGELANLAVAPAVRRRGVGRALLDAALNDADTRGIAEMYLEVRESNMAAVQLYEGAGFAPLGRRKAYYRNPVEDALVFRRTQKQRLR